MSKGRVMKIISGEWLKIHATNVVQVREYQVTHITRERAMKTKASLQRLATAPIDEPKEQRVAPEVTSERKICDLKHRCSEAYDWQAVLLLDSMRCEVVVRMGRKKCELSVTQCEEVSIYKQGRSYREIATTLSVCFGTPLLKMLWMPASISVRCVVTYKTACRSWVWQGSVFQQDYDPMYTARKTKEWLLYNAPRRLLTSPQSPDVNPIEHLTDYLGKQVQKHRPSSKQALQKLLLDEWSKISPPHITTSRSNHPYPGPHAKKTRASRTGPLRTIGQNCKTCPKVKHEHDRYPQGQQSGTYISPQSFPRRPIMYKTRDDLALRARSARKGRPPMLLQPKLCQLLGVLRGPPKELLTSYIRGSFVNLQHADYVKVRPDLQTNLTLELKTIRNGAHSVSLFVFLPRHIQGLNVRRLQLRTLARDEKFVPKPRGVLILVSHTVPELASARMIAAPGVAQAQAEGQGLLISRGAATQHLTGTAASHRWKYLVIKDLRNSLKLHYQRRLSKACSFLTSQRNQFLNTFLTVVLLELSFERKAWKRNKNRVMLEFLANGDETKLGRGGTVVRIFVSRLVRTGFDFLRGRSRIYACGNRAGTMPLDDGFSQGIRRAREGRKGGIAQWDVIDGSHAYTAARRHVLVSRKRQQCTAPPLDAATLAVPGQPAVRRYGLLRGVAAISVRGRRRARVYEGRSACCVRSLRATTTNPSTAHNPCKLMDPVEWGEDLSIPSLAYRSRRELRESTHSLQFGDSSPGKSFLRTSRSGATGWLRDPPCYLQSYLRSVYKALLTCRYTTWGRETNCEATPPACLKPVIPRQGTRVSCLGLRTKDDAVSGVRKANSAREGLLAANSGEVQILHSPPLFRVAEYEFAEHNPEMRFSLLVLYFASSPNNLVLTPSPTASNLRAVFDLACEGSAAKGLEWTLARDGNFLAAQLEKRRFITDRRSGELRILANCIAYFGQLAKPEFQTDGGRVDFRENGAAPERNGGGTGDPRENTPTSDIVRHDSHLLKSGRTSAEQGLTRDKTRHIGSRPCGVGQGPTARQVDNDRQLPSTSTMIITQIVTSTFNNCGRHRKSHALKNSMRNFDVGGELAADRGEHCGNQATSHFHALAVNIPRGSRLALLAADLGVFLSRSSRARWLSVNWNRIREHPDSTPVQPS
ncbi:hypothetical protein PR048_003025 [Dryococelus australis]|uniref:Uncharacterized protein n=1 Tax=Dryococelus australis TaxID=614101 RepID=A0ABQ9ILU8_9NEOP|nr:hypothetical protein PR048_003025 [Dryococelus australis]